MNGNCRRHGKENGGSGNSFLPLTRRHRSGLRRAARHDRTPVWGGYLPTIGHGPCRKAYELHGSGPRSLALTVDRGRGRCRERGAGRGRGRAVPLFCFPHGFVVS